MERFSAVVGVAAWLCSASPPTTGPAPNPAGASETSSCPPLYGKNEPMKTGTLPATGTTLPVPGSGGYTPAFAALLSPSIILQTKKPFPKTGTAGHQ